MKVAVYSPEGPLYVGEARSVRAVGVEGSFEVLEGHAPLIARLAPGPLQLSTPSGEKVFSLTGGFLWVEPRESTVHVVAS